MATTATSCVSGAELAAAVEAARALVLAAHAAAGLLGCALQPQAARACRSAEAMGRAAVALTMAARATRGKVDAPPAAAPPLVRTVKGWRGMKLAGDGAVAGAAAGVAVAAASPVPLVAKTKKKKARRRKTKMVYEDVAMHAAPAVPPLSAGGTVCAGGVADGGLGDEWADSLPARPSRLLAERPARERSRERSPKRRALVTAVSPPLPTLVPGCLAIVHGLAARADLNGSIVKLLGFDGDASRWRVETLDSEAVRVKADRLCLHLPPSGG
jgi:hypothetical protein